MGAVFGQGAVNCPQSGRVILCASFHRSFQMIKSIAIFAAAFISLSAFAQAPAAPAAAASTCSASAAEKKLAGAAKTSFMKKCESDAAATCELAATEKKLAGAAKAANVKKCTKDAVGG
jgi:hypothetical protein